MQLSILSRIPPCPGKKVPESFIFASLFIIDSIKSPTNAIREIKIPYKIPTNNGFSQLSKNAKNTANEIEQDIPPIKPSIVLLGDIAERDFLPNNLPTKYEPISLATIKKQELKVKCRPEELEIFSYDPNPFPEVTRVDSISLNLIQ